jgi:D-sedoheptulose 7-phosphate isomerase
MWVKVYDFVTFLPARLLDRNAYKFPIGLIERGLMTEQHEKTIREYMQRSSEIMRLLDGQAPKLAEIVSMLDKARERGSTIFIMGNGGSASTASHMANDLNKTACKEGGKRFKMMALTDNVPIMLAIGNDISYDDIFVEQLKNFLGKDDIVMGLSGSGNSKNVLKALEYANSKGAYTIGLTAMGGGKLAQLAKLSIIIPDGAQVGSVPQGGLDGRIQRAEDMHLMLTHIMVLALRNSGP